MMLASLHQQKEVNGWNLVDAFCFLFYVFTKLEVHSVMLFHSVYVFFLSIIRRKNHETKVRYTSYKVHCILLVFPTPLWLFILHLNSYKNNQKVKKINKLSKRKCFLGCSHPQFSNCQLIPTEMSKNRNEQFYKYFCISYCTEAVIVAPTGRII